MTTTVKRLVDRLPNRGRDPRRGRQARGRRLARRLGTGRVVDRRRRDGAAEVADGGHRPALVAQLVGTEPARPARLVWLSTTTSTLDRSTARCCRSAAGFDVVAVDALVPTALWVVVVLAAGAVGVGGAGRGVVDGRPGRADGGGGRGVVGRSGLSPATRRAR